MKTNGPPRSRDLAAVLLENVLHGFNMQLDHAETLRILDERDREIEDLRELPPMEVTFTEVAIVSTLRLETLRSGSDEALRLDIAVWISPSEALHTMTAFQRGALTLGYRTVVNEDGEQFTIEGDE